MTIISAATLKMHRFAQMLENPVLLALRRYGFTGAMLDTYQKLNQPWVRMLNLATVLDIGANIGQSAAMFHTIFPQARIYSFEPLEDCFDQLQSNMRGVKNFAAFNVALGERSGILTFERNTATASSSLLKMTETHKKAFPHTCESHPVSVRVECLDDMASQLAIIDPVLIKIDVQGYEDRVLRGGEQTIKRAKLIIIETSFEKLYLGQTSFEDVYHVLTNWGLSYKGSLDKLIDPRDGRTLQEDSIFVRQDDAPEQPTAVE